jgi:hypothetical protein
MSKYALLTVTSALVILTGCAKKAPLTPATPWADIRDDALCFLTTAADPSGLKVQYVFDWGNGDTTTTGLYKSGDTACCPRSFPDTGTFHIKVKARNEQGRASKWSDECLFHASTPPQLADTIVGLPRWAVDRWYRPSVKVMDPDGDSVSVKFIWGDSMASNWSPFVASGGTVTDSVKWQTTGRHVVHILLKDKGSMVNPNAGGKTVVVSAFGILWSTEPEDWFTWGTSPVVGTIGGNVVVFTFLENGLACFAADGRLLWLSQTSVDYPLYAPSLSADGSHLYYTDDNYGLFCLDAHTGAQVWNIDTLRGHICTPAVGPGNSVYVSSGVYDNRVVKVRDLGATAAVAWTRPLVHSGMAQIAITVSGGVYAVTNVYDTFPSVRVWMLDSSGAILWQDSTHLFYAEYGIDLAVDSRGRLIVGNEMDSLFCFNPDGTIAWRRYIPDLYPGGVTIGYDDRVYVHDAYERYYCLNSNGNEEWTFLSSEASVGFNSVCALADSSILAYADDGEYLTDIGPDGEVRWVYCLEDSLGGVARRGPRRDEGDECSTPAVGPDGNVYVSGYYLMCFACGNARLANTAWPTYNHDNARSGWAGRH